MNDSRNEENNSKVNLIKQGALIVSFDKNDRNYEDNIFEFIKGILQITSVDDEVDKKLYDDNQSFKLLYGILTSTSKITIVVEDDYIDKIYRDSYYSYYSGKHFEYSRYCVRLALFNDLYIDEKTFLEMKVDELQKHFCGCIVIRPIHDREIGRTLINPWEIYKIHNEKCYIRTTRYKVNIYGKLLEINAFPYSKQDGETTTCAEVTLLNLSDYFSTTYQEYYSILPSQIAKIAETVSSERRFPTTGLTYQQMSKVLKEIGFFPRLYDIAQMGVKKSRHVIHYYIESGIPIALGLRTKSDQRHSITVIGHGPINDEGDVLCNNLSAQYNNSNNSVIWISDSADTINEYCVQDDNDNPYQMYSIVEDMKEKLLRFGDYYVEYLLIPLYKRMYMEASDAYSICTSILNMKDLGIFDAMKDNIEVGLEMGINIDDLGGKNYPIVCRLFMASSKTFKSFRCEQFRTTKQSLQIIYSRVKFPKFIWACELYTIDSYKSDDRQAIGEIVLDATSAASSKVDSVILINYPFHVFERTPSIFINNNIGIEKSMFEPIPDWKGFGAFSGNLFNNIKT